MDCVTCEFYHTKFIILMGLIPAAADNNPELQIYRSFN